MMELMEFDTLERVCIKIHIKKENINYVLKEATEEDVNRYKDSQLSQSKIVDGEFAGLSGLHNTEALLLASCLFKVNADGLETPVGLQEVKQLPGRISKKLVEKLEDISGLKDNKTEEQLVKEIKKLEKKLEVMREKRKIGDNTIEDESLKN